ncbi:MAG: hypothetical protein FWC65_04195, partial [Treponema sp.]|nr:hypothetical protein [Treponema sp.]
MAEETDNTQRPKAELIKHAPSSPAEARVAAENGDSDADGAGKAGSGAENGERRKVIVVKKKPPAASAGISPPPAAVAGAPKRIQPKVVVAKGAAQEGDPEAAAGDPRAAVAPSPAPAPMAAEKTDAAPADAQIDSSKEKAPPAGQDPAKKGVPGTFSITQRPVAAAGRVGGKYVGPRPPHEESVRGGSGGHGPGGGHRPGGFGGGPRPGGFGGPGRGPGGPGGHGPGGGHRPGGFGGGP